MPDTARGGGRRLRKRPRSAAPQGGASLNQLLQHVRSAEKIVVFSGSGLSISAGMSMFSTNGGLYQRAQKQFKLVDGKKLFTYLFYEKQKLAVLAFFADIHSEAAASKPALGHCALAKMAQAGKLQRHYTMNIDGLSEAAGMSVWHTSDAPDGLTVEMHGSIHQLVCPACHQVTAMTPALLSMLKSKRSIACPCRPDAHLRCRIMLYDDAEDDAITPEEVFDVMESDVAEADLVLWVGISFEQSASTAYFRRVRSFLRSAGRIAACKQALINPSEDALWNLTSACSNLGDLQVLEVNSTSDEVLPLVAAACLNSAEPVPGSDQTPMSESERAAAAKLATCEAKFD